MTEQERQAFELGQRVERATVRLRLYDGAQAHTEVSQDGDFYLRYREKTYGPYGQVGDLLQAIEECIEMEQQREDFFLELDEGN